MEKPFDVEGLVRAVLGIPAEPKPISARQATVVETQEAHYLWMVDGELDGGSDDD